MNGIEWLRAAAIRAGKTAAQGALTLIGTNYVSITELDWLTIVGICCTMALCSMLTSVVGLPEVDAQEDEEEEDD